MAWVSSLPWALDDTCSIWFHYLSQGLQHNGRCVSCPGSLPHIPVPILLPSLVRNLFESIIDSQVLASWTRVQELTLQHFVLTDQHNIAWYYLTTTKFKLRNNLDLHFSRFVKNNIPYVKGSLCDKQPVHISFDHYLQTLWKKLGYTHSEATRTCYNMLSDASNFQGQTSQKHPPCLRCPVPTWLKKLHRSWVTLKN